MRAFYLRFFNEAILANSFAQSSATTLVAAGAFAGFTHGLLVSFSIVIEATGRHPLPEYRNAGFAVAAAHILGHIVYGLTIAVMMLWKADNVGALLDTVSNSKGALFLVAIGDCRHGFRPC